jgi:flagellar basal-body rod protein FlgB
MDLTQIPLFSVLAKRMAWLTDRQGVLAENVANADMPGYVARDLRPQDFRKLLAPPSAQVRLVTTEPGHIAATPDIAPRAAPETAGDATIDGNRVSLEAEMLKVSQTANDFALVSTLYRANLGMVKTVLGGSG